MLRYVGTFFLLSAFTVLDATEAKAQRATKPPPIIATRLVTNVDNVGEGTLGVHFAIPKGWHIYWKNAGEIGIPSKVQFMTPPDVAVGTPQWPAPHRFGGKGEATTFGYEEDVLIYAPFSVGEQTQGSTVMVRAKVSWLACDPTRCIPEKAVLSGVVSNASAQELQLLEESRSLVPSDSPESIGVRLTSVRREETGQFVLLIAVDQGHQNLEWFPEQQSCVRVEDLTSSATEAGVEVRFPLKEEPCSDLEDNLLESVVVVTTTTGERKSAQFSVPIMGKREG